MKKKKVFRIGDFIKIRNSAGSSHRGEHGIIYGKLPGYTGRSYVEQLYTGRWWKVYTTHKYDPRVSVMECDMIRLRVGSKQ